VTGVVRGQRGRQSETVGDTVDVVVVGNDVVEIEELEVAETASSQRVQIGGRDRMGLGGESRRMRRDRVEARV
jgi:hypothetical protein